MKLRVYVYGIGFNECLSGLIVSFGLDALDFGKKLCKQGAELHVVVDHKVSFSVTDLLFNHIVLGALFVAPLGNELAVLHVGLSVGAAKLHACELDHEAVADVIGVFGLICLRVRHYAKLYHLGVCGEIQAEKVCAGFLQGRCILSHGGGAYPGKKLAGAVSKAFVEVRVDFIGHGAPFLGKLYLLLIVRELREGARGHFLCGVVVGVRDVCDGDALGAVLLAYPVCVGKIDADGRGRIAVSGKANGVDYLCRNTLDLFLAEAGINRGVVLEPLGVGAEGFRALGGLEVLDVHVALPGGFSAQRVIVVLNEAVYEIHRSDGVLHPFDVELVPLAEVSGVVVLYEEPQGTLLDVIFGNLAGL